KASTHKCNDNFYQAKDAIRHFHVTGVQTCALPILEQELPSLRARVDEARATLIDAKLQRERLVRDLEETRALLEAARLERDEIIALERQLPIRSRVEVTSESLLPASAGGTPKLLYL